MKALLQTILFLFEDILRRWIENPLSVLAKCTITIVLVTISSIILISFYVSESSIETRIREFGGNNVVIREYTSTAGKYLKAYSTADFVLKRNDVKQFSVISVPAVARTEFGTSAQIFTSPIATKDHALGPAATLYSDTYPAGVESFVQAFDNRIPVVTRASPDWLKRIATGDIIFLPYALCREAVVRDYETITVLQVAGGPEAAVALANSIEQLIQLENRQRTRVLSPEALLQELERVRANQSLWQWAIVLGMGSAMAIILSVISLLEYKQWEFYAALLRSLGMHSAFIYFRYVVDALIPTVIAGGATLYTVAALAGIILPSIGVDAVNLKDLNIYQFINEEGSFLLAFLAIGATVGSLPVAVLLRKPIGKVMA